MLQNKRIVLYIVEDTKNAQFRYRCANLLEATRNSKRWQVQWFPKNEIKKAEKILDKVSLVVIERQAAKNDEVLSFIKKIKENNIKVIFDLDDLVFDYKDLPVLMNSINSKNIFYWFGYLWGIRRIAKRADGFICTNDFLGKKLKKSFKKPCRIIPNSIDNKQIEISEEIIKKDKSKFETRKHFLIGYFSGSPTHFKDFMVAEPEIIKFLNDNKNTKLRVVGYMKFSNVMKKMIKAGRVEVLELVDYVKLQQLVSEVDVNIAPLLINDFTNCKSELKFFEAAIVETTTIASPTYTFKKAINDGENGFLAQPGEWYDKLEYLYEHPKENQKIAKAAKKYALKHYYGKEFLKEIEETYDFFAS